MFKLNGHLSYTIISIYRRHITTHGQDTTAPPLYIIIYPTPYFIVTQCYCNVICSELNGHIDLHFGAYQNKIPLKMYRYYQLQYLVVLLYLVVDSILVIFYYIGNLKISMKNFMRLQRTILSIWQPF